MDYYAIISMLVTFLLGFVATYMVVVRKYLKVLKEAADVFYAFDSAFADSELTTEEVKKIYEEAKEVIDAVKNLKKK